jgi:hypothetical protein
MLGGREVFVSMKTEVECINRFLVADLYSPSIVNRSLSLSIHIFLGQNAPLISPGFRKLTRRHIRAHIQFAAGCLNKLTYTAISKAK